MEDGSYREGRLALADDLQDADADAVLSFSQAQAMARQWWQDEQRADHGLTTARRGLYTVAQACDDYLEDYRRRGGRAVTTLGYAYACHVLPKLGGLQVARLATLQLQDWHRSLAEQAHAAAFRGHGDCTRVCRQLDNSEQRWNSARD